ncbi:universal stress protein [Halioxenophilus aromaticivorans]|uniref:Universal stress protein UspE n=1 Tax=Halioxenophilus aromaticivorans TaxID=1306992 RepID=A0AAV3U3F0_9ALTE
MEANILAVWEYDNPSDLALEKAHWLALNQGSTLSVLGYSCSQSSPIADDALHVLASDVVGNNIKLLESSCIAPDQINPWLLSANASKRYQLVVKTAAKHNSDVKDENDWQLIRQLPHPLLLTMNRKWKTEKFRVLATLDISDDSEEQLEMNRGVLSVAKAAQAKLNAELHAAYVIAIPKTLSELAIKESDEVLHKDGDKAHRALDLVLADAGIQGAHSHVLAGAVQDEITSLANKKKYDLVIMGSVGRKGIKGMLLGNTAEKAIENIREDLLVIKPSY